MGIPSYFSYIVKNHANIIRKISANPIKIDNLYLDCNSIIYDSFYKMETTTMSNETSNEIISRTIKTIQNYIELLKPTNNVIIAFDGVAPVAKLEQQRSRRFKSLYQTNISKTIYKNVLPDAWNTTAITPGTIFMKNLDEEVSKFFRTPSKFGVSSIVFSGSNICGEGEHKIFEYIRQNRVAHLGLNTVIYGLDADLIMLSINHLPITPNIYLFRETPEFIKSINAELEPNETYMLDIPELANIITLNMNNGENLTTNEQTNRIYDYIFMCFLLGNDFMPHFPALNIRTGGIDKLLNAYKVTIGNTNENLTDGNIIYWKNVRKLVEFLVKNEHDYIKQEHKIRDRREKNKLPDITQKDKMDYFINIPTYERAVEKFINPFKDNWQYRYYKSLFDIEINESKLKEICMNYLQGLEWTIKYYTTGCVDWRWCYNYSYPPLLEDLIHYIPYFNTELLENKQVNPVNNLVQLCYVLPRQSLHFLPERVYKALIKEKNSQYKTDCEFLWAYCKYFWECHPNLPHIDINELENFVNKNM